MRVGFIGLGDQGSPMAERVLAAGYELMVYARRPEVGRHFAELGADLAESPADLGRCDLIEVCVVDDAQVDDVLLRGGILETMMPGAIVAIHSTVHPETCRRLGEQAQRFEVEVLDAPVSGGGAKAAREAQLVTLVGGSIAAYDQVRPVFECFGSSIYLGPLGSGQLAKLLNNLFFAVQMGASYELVRLGIELGIDREGLSRALPGCTAASWVLERYAASGFTHLAPPIGGGHQHVLRLLEKDVSTFERVAAQLGVDAAMLQDVALHGIRTYRRGGELVFDSQIDIAEYTRRISVLTGH